MNAEPIAGFFLRTSFWVQLEQKVSAKLGPLPSSAPIFDERTYLVSVPVTRDAGFQIGISRRTK